MWVEELANGKFKYVERYEDPYAGKLKKVSTTLTSDSTHAQKKALKLLNERINNKLKNTATEDVPFINVLNEWFTGHKKTLRPSSIKSFEAQIKIINQHIDQDVLINRMDARLIQTFFDDLDYSNEYLSGIKSMLNQAFEYGVDKNFVSDTPMPKVKINYKAKTLEDYQRITDKYLEIDEAEALITELQRVGRTYRVGRLAEFLFLTGMRIGEAVILKQSDFADNHVKVTGTIDFTNGYKLGKKGPTKTLKGNRDILLTPRTLNLVKRSIEENKLADERYTDRGFIFTTKSGTPVQTNSFNLSLKKAGERLGINKQLSSHIFRHTHVSLLAENNVPLQAVMERVGHEDSKITQEVYTHVTGKMKTNIVSTLDNLGL